MTKDKSSGSSGTTKNTKTNKSSRSKRADAKAAGSAQAAKVTAPSGRKSERNRAAGDSSYLGVDDFKHFREVFRKKSVLDKEIIEDTPLIPPLPTDAGPEQVVTPQKARRRGRGPQKAPTKVLTSIRLDKHVYEYYKSSGRGWQSRINDMLTAQMQKEIRSQKRKERAAAKAGAKSSESKG